MKSLSTLLGVHVVVLVLASTCFTIITGLRDGHFRWEWFQFSSQRGWGIPYQFPYTLPVVVAYLSAYAVGVAAYCTAYRGGSQVIGVLGVALCGVGFASF